jgi:16S rRNA (guanine527-N7)-methyltransferase
MPAAPPEPAPLDAAAAARALGVSRETRDRLEAYLQLLRRWQGTINLVGAATLADPWRRHILDCGQLWRWWPPDARRLVDIGSGAGLPGLILAILGAPEVHLIESDRRKAAFLREAARAAGVEAVVHGCRAEGVRGVTADVLTARAVAPLASLLDLAYPFLAPSTVGLLLKGRGAAEEAAAALRTWRLQVEMHPSLSDSDGRVLVLRDLRRA